MNKSKNSSEKIVVIGSTNTDMVIRTKKIPEPGETVLGGTFFMNPGGKGANQAVAAARLGGQVAFIGRIGADVFGEKARKGLKSEGIDVRWMRVDGERASGVATITVDESGENAIVVAAGANAALSLDDIEAARQTISDAAVLLLQLETNMESVTYAIASGKGSGPKVILNPAPYADIPKKCYPDLFLITPNESEAEGLTGIKIENENGAHEAARILKERGVKNVVITLGALGAYVLSDSFSGLITGKKVEAVDTTAAGDTFNGALAVAIAKGKSVKEAVEQSNLAAAFSVTRLGAQQSCPTLKELESQFLGNF